MISKRVKSGTNHTFKNLMTQETQACKWQICSPVVVVDGVYSAPSHMLVLRTIITLNLAGTI